MRAGKLPPAALFGILALAVVGIGVSLYMRRGDTPPPQGDEPGATAGMVFRKCAGCGNTDEVKREDAGSKGWLDFEGTRLMGDGAKCPKCGKDRMAVAKKCPKDGTIFVPSVSAEGVASGCPKCGGPAGPGV